MANKYFKKLDDSELDQVNGGIIGDTTLICKSFDNNLKSDLSDRPTAGNLLKMGMNPVAVEQGTKIIKKTISDDGTQKSGGTTGMQMA